MQARRIRPEEAGALDRRRLAAAGLSALLPGLGQLFNRRTRLAISLPDAGHLSCFSGLPWLLLATQSPARLFVVGRGARL